MGQIPQDCRLSDCCSYAMDNGIRHLDSLARALDATSSGPFTTGLLDAKSALVVDLGSGAGLSWFLLFRAGVESGRLTSLTVANVDHARNMHRVAMELSPELERLLQPHSGSVLFHHFINPAGLLGLLRETSPQPNQIFVILNHLLHQNQSSLVPVPQVVVSALDACLKLADRFGVPNVRGISIEPWGLDLGYGQRGLIGRVRTLGGSTFEPVRIAGDKAGKSVLAFSYPATSDSCAED
jgi:hypothetical protein